MTCKRCGCTERTPCVRDGVPCAWQLPDLCTFCLTPEEAAIDRAYAGILASLRDEQLYQRCLLAVAQGLAANPVIQADTCASHLFSARAAELATALLAEAQLGVPEEEDDDPARRLVTP